MSGADENKQTQYSQYGDDFFIQRFFASLEIPKPSYLDIGANHPVDLNNTYLFYANGSRGVLVEPNKALAELIKAVRPEDTLLNIGVAGAEINERAQYYTSGAGGVYNSFVKENIEWHGRSADEAEVLELVNINVIIEQNFETAPDFVSLDVEGMEVDIMRTFDFSRFRPKLFCIEVPVKPDLKESLYALMRQHDYSVIYEPQLYGNVIFADKIFAEKALGLKI
jgi:FkbM family methyltransferase